MNFAAIAASQPVNKAAAMARTMKGDVHEVHIPKGLAHFKAPPAPIAAWRPSLGENLVGRRVGRLNVIRLHGVTKAGRTTWLVRCDCGDFELRTDKSIKRGPQSPDEACYVCNKTSALAKAGSQRHTGDTRAAAAVWLDDLAAGAADGILGAYVVCPDPKNRVKWNVRSPRGAHVFSPGLWDRWAADQACQAINEQRGFGEDA